MISQESVLEFKCPCCNAPLLFSGSHQQMKCEYCENTFDLDTIQACAETDATEHVAKIHWEQDGAVRGLCRGLVIDDCVCNWLPFRPCASGAADRAWRCFILCQRYLCAWSSSLHSGPLR